MKSIGTTPIYKNLPSFIARLPVALRNRRAVIIFGLLVLTLGMTLNWGWLTAVGAAPILLSLAPCAAMCAVGICCMKGNRKQKSSDSGES